MKIMSYNVYEDDLNKITITDTKQVVNTINPHSYVTAKSDAVFEEALRDSDILIPDGSGIVLAAKQINNEPITKIAGSDLHIHLLKQLNKEKKKCFYMGSSEHTLDALKKRLNSEYPDLKAEFYSPPFKDKFSDKENQEIIEAINKFNPDVLFVGMTAPKQEKWLHEYKNRLNFKIATSIGAVFDFYAGTVIRPSQFWLDLHLEWFARLLKEPKRLWRRNFVSTPLFLVDVMLFKIKIKK